MRLITGGRNQGKKEYALNYYQLAENDLIDGRDCAFLDIYQCAGIVHVEELIKRCLKEGKEEWLAGLAARLKQHNPDILLINDEVGNGIVPLDAFERHYREQAGRICTQLAAEAEEVHRVICGIGMVLKGRGQ